MLSLIASRIANKFRDADTKIVSITDVNTPHSLISHYEHRDPDKNLIILFRNTSVMKNVHLTVVRSNTPSKVAVTTEESHVNSSVASSVNEIKKMTDGKVLIVYYPSFEKYKLDPRLIQKNKGTSTHVKSKPGASPHVVQNIEIQNKTDGSLRSMLTPGGDSVLIVIEKGVDNIKIDLSRRSYIDQVCSTSSATSPAHPRCPKNWNRWFIGIIITLMFLVVALVILYVMGSKNSPQNPIKSETLGTVGGTPNTLDGVGSLKHELNTDSPFNFNLDSEIKSEIRTFNSASTPTSLTKAFGTSAGVSADVRGDAVVDLGSIGAKLSNLKKFI